VQALAQVGARLGGCARSRPRWHGDDARRRERGQLDHVVGSITIGRLSRKRAALALTTTTSGSCSAIASRTSSHRIVSPAM
jgi:hypothetical protein